MNKIILSILILFVGGNAFSQDINNLSNRLSVKKVKITLKESKYMSENFRNLNYNDGIISYKDSKNNLIEKNISEVYRITKRGTYVGFGSLSGGLLGLAASLLVTDESSEYDPSSYELPSGDDWFTISVSTIGGAVIGGLIGLMIKKQETIYFNSSSVSLNSNIMTFPNGNHCQVLSLKVNF